ncbi:MAG: restriction endonuclease subunit S [Methylococcaceae bacterium]|nr:MAG: restriction endonuclease subunit S [Methylococcaceae bacterium]
MANLAFNILKKTDVIWLPQIPEHWEIVKVRHLFKESTKKGFPHETLLVASQEHGVVSKDAYGKRTVEATKDFHNLKLVEQGDYVISLRSFQGGIELAHQRGIISPAYTVLKETKLIDKRYFKNLFKSPPFISLMTLCVKGIREGQNIDYPTFKNEFLPFPPIEEQKAIAEYLDKKNNEIDRFIRNKEKLIELLEESKKNAIDVAFTRGVNAGIELKETDFEWLSNIPNHWNLKRLKFLSKIISKGSTPSTEGREMTSSGIRFVKAENIFKSKIVSEPAFFIDPITHKVLKRSQLKENDLLFVIAGATIGKVAIVSIEHLPANTNQAVSFIRLKNKEDVEFCYYWLHSKFITTNIWLNAVTSAQPNLAMEDLGNLTIPYPPNDEEKAKIVQHLKYEHSVIDTAISKAQQEITSIKEYREALITDLVTGKRCLPPSTAE